MFLDIIKLAKTVEDWTRQSPSDAPELLKAIARGMDGYEAGIKRQRNHLAVQAIDNLIGLLSNYGKSNKLCWKVLKDEEKAVYLIDAIVYNFPKGWETIMHQNGKEMLERFCKWYFDPKTTPFRGDWEINIKGHGDYMEMLFDQCSARNLLSDTGEY